jgi:hypothetical protein
LAGIKDAAPFKAQVLRRLTRDAVETFVGGVGACGDQLPLDLEILARRFDAHDCSLTNQSRQRLFAGK